MPNQAVRFNDFPLAFQLGLSTVYKDELKIQPKSYLTWLREDAAEHFYDTEWATAGLGMAQPKAIGQAMATDVVLSGKTKSFTLKTFGLAVAVQHEAIAWDLYKIFARIPQLLAKSSVDRYNLEAYSLFSSAFTTSDPYYQTFQGEPIIKLAHTRIDGGTWKNRPTINLGLSYLALQQARIDIRRLVNERGRYTVGLGMKRLITSPEQEWVAREILDSQYRSDNNNMQVNQMKAELGGGDAVHVSPFILSQLPFFIACDKSDYSIRMRQGEAPDFEKENVPATRSQLYTTYFSFRLDVMDSRGLWGSSGDGATSA